MSMDGNFKVIQISTSDILLVRKIVKEFSGRKGFEKANDMRDKLNEKADKLTYYYVKGDLCLGP